MEAIRIYENRLELLDQTLLPYREEWLSCYGYREVIKAIQEMKVRGAPLLGVVGAMAVYLAFLEYKSSDDFENEFLMAFKEISEARPTARELAYQAGEIFKVIVNQKVMDERVVFESVKRILEDGKTISSKMIANGLTLIKPNSRILTHCNSGSLAVMGEGSALGVIKEAYRKGLVEMVYVDETRPLLQGSRLTSYELSRAGIPHRIITDSSAPYLMSLGMIDMVILGADRISQKGDVANKIGTYSLAVASEFNNLPFIVVAPEATFDPLIEDGKDIIIEERDENEVLIFNGLLTAPAGSKAINLAFDVTPHYLVTAIVTEDRIIYPSDHKSSNYIIKGFKGE